MDTPTLEAEFLTTGQAAKLLMVTRDAVVKWIKQGKITAVRTTGGHYRISVESLRPQFRRRTPSHEDESGNQAKPRLYCWEHHSAGGVFKDECRTCLVFKVKGAKCYEASHFLRRAGFGASCCPTSCDECSFYKDQLEQRVKVLVFSKDKEIEVSLTEESKFSRFYLQFVHSEYECARIVDSFRPDCVLVDCGSEKELEDYRQLCRHLLSDPRIPGAQILLAVPRERKNLPEFCSDMTVIGRPFALADVEEHCREINSHREESHVAEEPRALSS